MTRTILLAALAAPLACLALEGSDPERVFHRALETFDAARRPSDFLEAARLFEVLVAGGHENGAVLYNLGNAYMRAGRIGHAIAAYRRAKRLLPRDPYVEANLQAALAAAPEASRPPETPWWRRVLFWDAWLSQAERLWLGASAWCLAFVLATIRLLACKGPSAARRALGWCACACLLAGLLVSAGAAMVHAEQHGTRHAVLLEETVARKGNGESYDPAFDRPLKEGAECVVLEERAGWVNIRLPAGDAWVPERSLVCY